MLNEILGPAARLQQRLTRLFQITGGAPSPQITPEITPVLEMGDMPIEDRFSARERIFSWMIKIGAHAATMAEALIVNPSGSGILIIVQPLVVNTDTGQDLVYIESSPPINQLGTLVAGVVPARDSRIINPATGFSFATAVISYDNLGSGGNTVYNEWVTLQNTGDKNTGLEYVLAPNSSLLISGQTANKSLAAGFTWRERPVASGELLV